MPICVIFVVAEMMTNARRKTKIMIANTSPITRFEILGLYGDRDIILDFDRPIKILVDENGSGKTTVLNILFRFISFQAIGHCWLNMSFVKFVSPFQTPRQ